MVYIKLVNTVRVNADHMRDFRHMTKIRNFTMRELSAFPFSLHLMFD